MIVSIFGMSIITKAFFCDARVDIDDDNLGLAQIHT